LLAGCGHWSVESHETKVAASIDSRLSIEMTRDEFLNTALSVNWHAAPGWRLGLGGRWIEQDIRNSNLRNELEVGDLVYRVAHDFF
jgi:hypothetical protein